MAKVIATERGYFGGVIREIGDAFVIPDEVWNDERRRPTWCQPAKFGGKGDHDGDGKVGGSKPAKPAGTGEPVQIPADWQNGSAAERKALAKAISGANVPNAKEADEIIERYLEAAKPEAFGDAPPPQAAPQGNGVQEALGGPAPDWVAPAAPQPVTD